MGSCDLCGECVGEYHVGGCRRQAGPGTRPDPVHTVEFEGGEARTTAAVAILPVGRCPVLFSGTLRTVGLLHFMSAHASSTPKNRATRLPGRDVDMGDGPWARRQDGQRLEC